jgi:hypothetical protein
VPLLQPTKDLLRYLRENPRVRFQIAAQPNRTLLYAGSYFMPMWRELEQLRLTNREIASKDLLPDVLGRIATPGRLQPTLLAWAKSLDSLVSWEHNGFVAWRALSGIFAANATGVVSFYVGSGVARADKVFAATEISVLLRNPNISPLTRDVLAYYQRCIQSRVTDLNFGFIGG